MARKRSSAPKKAAGKKPSTTPLRAPSNRIAERNAMLAARARENLEKAIKSKAVKKDTKGKKKAVVKTPSVVNGHGVETQPGGGNGKKTVSPPPGFAQLPFMFNGFNGFNGNGFNSASGGSSDGNSSTSQPLPPPGFMYPMWGNNKIILGVLVCSPNIYLYILELEC